MNDTLKELNALANDLLKSQNPKVKKSEEEVPAKEIVEDVPESPKKEEPEKEATTEATPETTEVEKCKKSEEEIPAEEMEMSVKKSEFEAMKSEIAALKSQLAAFDKPNGDNIAKATVIEETQKPADPNPDKKPLEKATVIEETQKPADPNPDKKPLEKATVIEETQKPADPNPDKIVSNPESMAKGCDCKDGETCPECEDKDDEQVIAKSMDEACDYLNSILYNAETKYTEINKSIDAITEKLDSNLNKSMEVMSAKLEEYNTLAKSMEAKSNGTTEVLAKSLKALLDSNRKIMETNSEIKKSVEAYNGLTEKVEGLEKALSDISTVITSLQSTQEAESHEPARMRKSYIGQTVERNFNASMGQAEAPAYENLTKSQISDILANEVISGSKVITADHLTAFETGATLPPAIMEIVSRRAKNN